MREAIGNSFILNFIITFIIIFILIFVGTLTYTKAFKVKNKIIDIIEYNDGEIANGNAIKGNIQGEIESKLSSIGYRYDKSSECTTDGRFGDTPVTKGESSYRYCIYQHKTNRGYYYGVVAYAYLEIPIIGAKLSFPVYGETKIFNSI